MRHVRLHAAAGIVLTIDSLRGEMISRDPASPPVFDDQRSYVLKVNNANISVDMPSLSHLMNDFVFAYEGSPLKDLSVEIDDGRLKQKGKMHKGVWLPFSMKAGVAPTADGRLRLHAESVSAVGLPATKLLDLFGLQLDELIKIKDRRGVEIKDDDVIVAPGRVLPPPEIQGRLTKAEIVGDTLHLVYGADAIPARLTPPAPEARNYIYFAHSSIRFGKLTMRDADLQLIDADDRDWFDFSPQEYEQQLVAGYSKNTPAKGLKTYMPDLDDLKHGAGAIAPARRSPRF